MPNPTTQNTILIDWGTSNLRAYLMSPSNECIEERSAPLGVKKIGLGKCEETLVQFIGDWLKTYTSAEILMSGMVGSELGWSNVRPLMAPCGAADIAEQLMQVKMGNGRPAWVVPGILSNNTDRLAGMMRGEEVQALGVMAVIGQTQGVVCLPGSHSKWVVVSDGKISDISTFMTGEMFDLMRTNSVLSGIVEGAAQELDQAGFREGLDLAHSGRNIMQLMFSIRTESVAYCRRDPNRDIARLSGILIGAEIRSVLSTLEHAVDTPVILTAAANLTAPYKVALNSFGQEPIIVDDNSAYLAGCSAILSEILTK